MDFERKCFTLLELRTQDGFLLRAGSRNIAMVGSDSSPEVSGRTPDCATQSRDAALVRIPHAEFLLTAKYGDAQGGVLVQRVQICGTTPPMLLIAMEKGHALSPLIRDSRTFGLSLLGARSRLLARLFSDDRNQHDDPFVALPTKIGALGAPIVTRAEAWYDCEVIRHFDVESNYEVYVGLVRDAALEKTETLLLQPRASVTRADPHSRKSETARLPHIAHLPSAKSKSRGRR